MPSFPPDPTVARRAWRGAWLLLWCLALLCAGCADPYNAELVILRCVDQDGAPLAVPVTVTVNGVLATWQGAPLRFPLKVKRDVELLTIRADAGDPYVYASKRQYDVRPGDARRLDLRFFRPYRVTVEAYGQHEAQLAGVAVYAEGRRIGETDAQGRLVWTIRDPIPPTGFARPGTRFRITLERGGERAVAAPVVIEQARYAYATGARLDLAGSPPDGASDDDEAAPPPRAPTDQPVARSPATRSPARPTLPAQRAPSPLRAQPAAVEPAVSPAAPVPAPPAAATFMAQGEQALAAGRYAEAIDLFNRVRPTDPTYKQALNNVGKARLRAGDYEGAVAAYREILKIDPTEYAPHNNLAAVYLASQNYVEADRELDQILAKKHLIPLEDRKHAEREARYNKALLLYQLFQNERDQEKKKNIGYRSLQVLQRFIDLASEDEAGPAAKRREIEDKRRDVLRWLNANK